MMSVSGGTPSSVIEGTVEEMVREGGNIYVVVSHRENGNIVQDRWSIDESGKTVLLGR